jgi:hypothetical protein
MGGTCPICSGEVGKYDNHSKLRIPIERYNHNIKHVMAMRRKITRKFALICLGSA